MWKKKKQQQEQIINSQVSSSPINRKEIPTSLNKTTVKELIAPSGIDGSKMEYLKIISTLPRMCTFPNLFREMYLFGDINTSVYIRPVSEAKSQNDLNKVINELETERLVARDRGNINRESTLMQKRFETEQLRDEIAAGFNKLYEASIVATLFSNSVEDLDKQSKMLVTEMSKDLVEIKSAWGIQEEAFKSNVPLMDDKVQRKHTFDRLSMGTVFPFTTSEVGHDTGVPIGFNKQTGTPIIFDNFLDANVD